jgi:hypothetical protein
LLVSAAPSGTRRKKAAGARRNNKRLKKDNKEAENSDCTELNDIPSKDCDDDSDENRMVDVGASNVIEELEDDNETPQGR